MVVYGMVRDGKGGNITGAAVTAAECWYHSWPVPHVV